MIKVPKAEFTTVSDAAGIADHRVVPQGFSPGNDPGATRTNL